MVAPFLFLEEEMAEVNYNAIKKQDPDTPDGKPMTSDINARIRKTSSSRKFLNAIVPEAKGNIREFIVYDLLVPYIRDLIRNTIVRSTDMIFYGTSQEKDSKRNYRNYSDPSYKRYASPAREERRRGNSRYVEDIVFGTRADAERLLSKLKAIIADDGYCRVADVYDELRLAGNGHTDNDFGWYDLREAYPRPCDDGWEIIFPPARDLR